MSESFLIISWFLLWTCQNFLIILCIIPTIFLKSYHMKYQIVLIDYRKMVYFPIYILWLDLFCKHFQNRLSKHNKRDKINHVWYCLCIFKIEFSHQWLKQSYHSRLMICIFHRIIFKHLKWITHHFDALFTSRW